MSSENYARGLLIPDRDIVFDRSSSDFSEAASEPGFPEPSEGTSSAISAGGNFQYESLDILVEDGPEGAGFRVRTPDGELHGYTASLVPIDVETEVVPYTPLIGLGWVVYAHEPSGNLIYGTHLAQGPGNLQIYLRRPNGSVSTVNLDGSEQFPDRARNALTIFGDEENIYIYFNNRLSVGDTTGANEEQVGAYISRDNGETWDLVSRFMLDEARDLNSAKSITKMDGAIKYGRIWLVLGTEGVAPSNFPSTVIYSSNALQPLFFRRRWPVGIGPSIVATDSGFCIVALGVNPDTAGSESAGDPLWVVGDSFDPFGVPGAYDQISIVDTSARPASSGGGDNLELDNGNAQTTMAYRLGQVHIFYNPGQINSSSEESVYLDIFDDNLNNLTGTDLDNRRVVFQTNQYVGLGDVREIAPLSATSTCESVYLMGTSNARTELVRFGVWENINAASVTQTWTPGTIAGGSWSYPLGAPSGTNFPPNTLATMRTAGFLLQRPNTTFEGRVSVSSGSAFVGLVYNSSTTEFTTSLDISSAGQITVNGSSSTSGPFTPSADGTVLVRFGLIGDRAVAHWADPDIEPRVWTTIGDVPVSQVPLASSTGATLTFGSSAASTTDWSYAWFGLHAAQVNPFLGGTFPSQIGHPIVDGTCFTGGTILGLEKGPYLPGDEFSISKASPFSVEQMIPICEPSPSCCWRSEDIALGDQASLEFTWANLPQGEERFIERGLWGFKIIGANFRSAKIQGFRNGAWADLADLNLSHQINYERRGDTIFPALSSTNNEDVWYYRRNEFKDGTFYNGVKTISVVGNSEGRWESSTEGTFNSTVKLKEVTGSEPETGSGELWSQDALVIVTELDQQPTFERFRVLINDQGTDPVPYEGYYRICQLVMGPIVAFSCDYSETYVHQYEHGTRLITLRDGSRSACPDNKGRRRVELTWSDGIIMQATQAPNSKYSDKRTHQQAIRASGTCGMEPTFIYDLMRDLNGPGSPIVYIPYIEADSSSALAQVSKNQLCRGAIYGRIVSSTARLENIGPGDEQVNEVMRIGTVTIEEEL